MHEQLKLLVSLQDLDTMIRETSDPERLKELISLGFEVKGLETLKKAREKLAGTVERRYLLLYERTAKKLGRAVVPVEGRTCLGCFQNLPGSFFSEISASEPVKVCENCGRILYMLNP
jgi:predicted  nucleic acid-binding Zn-ribbon protein